MSASGFAVTLCAGTASAQFAESKQSVSVAFSLVDFTYAGSQLPEADSDNVPRFDFSGATYGLRYSRAGIHAVVSAGGRASEHGQGGLLLLDASLASEGLKQLQGFVAGGTRMYFPLGLAATYRRVIPLDESDPLIFDATTIGAGLGMVLASVMGERMEWRLNVRPVVGVVSSSNTDSFGLAYHVDADAELQVTEFRGRFGLIMGYVLRYQVWDNRGSRVFSSFPDELYDYRGLQHCFRLGVNF